MAFITVNTTIAAPVERVFDVFTDLEQAPNRMPAIKKIEKLTPGPFAVGTRWKETRVMFNRESTEEMWVTDLVPCRSYTVEAQSCGTHFKTVFSFEPQGNQTQVAMAFAGRAVTLTARIMFFLTGWMMKGMIKKCFAEDLEALKKAAELSAEKV